MVDLLLRSALCGGLPGTYLGVLMITISFISIVSCSFDIVCWHSLLHLDYLLVSVLRFNGYDACLHNQTIIERELRNVGVATVLVS
jgi:hypothetical protein